MNTRLFNADCLDLMATLPAGSVDLVLTDPPYGTTACKWDSIIPLEPMWEQLKRLIKKNGAIVLTASQPFTTTLISSNMKMFKYCWVWDKQTTTGFYDAEFRPLRQHEDILIFSEGAITWAGRMRRMPYYPQGVKPHEKTKWRDAGECYKRSKKEAVSKGKNFPRSILSFNVERGLHPTQKPVALMEYLIKTYTNEGETVLDFTMGSGTTGVACKNLNRSFIGIEKDEKYFKIAKDRIGLND
jgi:site-specific DNA-methyltransferase (adenine-specific)